jgi:hypothetical protein
MAAEALARVLRVLLMFAEFDVQYLADSLAQFAFGNLLVRQRMLVLLTPCLGFGEQHEAGYTSVFLKLSRLIVARYATIGAAKRGCFVRIGELISCSRGATRRDNDPDCDGRNENANNGGPFVHGDNPLQSTKVT